MKYRFIYEESATGWGLMRLTFPGWVRLARHWTR